MSDDIIDLEGLIEELNVAAGVGDNHCHSICLQAIDFVKSQDNQIAAKDARIEELEKSRLSDLFLANFPYEHWDYGEDENMRLNDWVHLGWQDHNGNDNSDGIGRICLHHQTEIPVILMVEGFEDDGEPHGTYAPMSYHPWSTICRISEDQARTALKGKA